MSLDAFLHAKRSWSKAKAFQAFETDQHTSPPKQFVTNDGAAGNPHCWQKLRDISVSVCKSKLDYDIVFCGGTLGSFFATYLQLKGHTVCVLEAEKLQGREQEWNISMDEIDELIKLGVPNANDVDDEVITTSFPTCRSGFKNKEITPLSGGYNTW